MLRLSLAAPLLLALALRADEAAGQTQTYAECVSQNCGATPSFPNYFTGAGGTTVDIDRVNDWVCAAKGRKDFVECVCNNCATYSEFQGWAGYTYGVCDVVGATPSSMVATVSYYPANSCGSGTSTETLAFASGGCNPAGGGSNKVTCSADGSTYTYETFASSACSGTATATHSGIPTSGCYPDQATGRFSQLTCYGSAGTCPLASASTCSLGTCAQAGEVQGWTFKGGEAPDGCNKCSATPTTCKKMVEMVGPDGCFGECGWALSDKTIGEMLSALGGCESDKEDLKKALKEGEDKYGNAAATVGLSMIAAAATAAAAVAVAR